MWRTGMLKVVAVVGIPVPHTGRRAPHPRKPIVLHLDPKVVKKVSWYRVCSWYYIN